jgi:hypothetical protein
MREVLPPIRLPHEKAPILIVESQTWHCGRCDPDSVGPVAGHTVVWRGQNLPGPMGRCSSCGQHYVVAEPGEAVPSIQEQIHSTA